MLDNTMHSANATRGNPFPPVAPSQLHRAPPVWRKSVEAQAAALAFRDCGIEWSPQRQLAYVGERRREHFGPSVHAPSRELARVLLGTGSRLDWVPEGSDEQRVSAEFVTTLLDNLLDQTWQHASRRVFDSRTILYQAMSRMNGYADPRTGRFPLALEASYREFCWNLNPLALIRLSPYYFSLKQHERADADQPRRELAIRFTDAAFPPVAGLVKDCQIILTDVLRVLIYSTSIYEFRRAATDDVADPADPARRWAPSSFLEGLDHGEKEIQIAGRKRLDAAGRLADKTTTTLIRTRDEAAAVGVLLVENFLTAEQCDSLTMLFDVMADKKFNSDEIDPYWNNRAIWFSDIAKDFPEAGKLMHSARRGATNLISDFYRLRAPLYADMMQLLQWPQGLSMSPHADNIHTDGSPHLTPYRDFGNIIYLNEDFAGGEIYLTGQNALIKPRRGMLLSFTGGFHHEHAVTRVESGIRITMPFFLTFNGERQDPALA